MRPALLFALSVVAGGVIAQQPPPKLEPLPEAPPPPVIRDGADEPAVRIAPQEGDKIEEVRDGGRVVRIRVTPPGGVPYELQDYVGSGNPAARGPLDKGLSVPMWTITTFE